MVTTRAIEYAADGKTMIGHLAVPDGDGPRAAVLVAPEANGLDEHIKKQAERLAELGYVALGLDFHGGGEVASGAEDMMSRLASLGSDPDRIRSIGHAALAAMLDEPRADPARVAPIGFCFGGTLSLELARDGADLKAVCGFHSGLQTGRPAQAGQVRPRVLVCIGAEDPFVPAEQRLAFEEEMRGAGAEWQVNVYGGAKHSFTRPNATDLGLPGVEYHEPTARRSWRAMLDLFAETLA